MTNDEQYAQRAFLRPQPAPSAEEVRASVRFPLHLPVEIAPEGAVPIHAETRDISANGLLLTTDSELPSDSNIEFTIRMPAGVLGTMNDVMVHGRGRIVRSYRESAQNMAAAVIDDYTLETVPDPHDIPERTH